MSLSFSYSFILYSCLFYWWAVQVLYFVLLIFIQFVVRDEFIFILTSCMFIT